MTLRAVDRATHAGRPAVDLEGQLRPYPVHVYMNNFPIGADVYDILIDAERGVLLRVEPRFKGRPIMLSEVTSIACDNVPDDVFTFVPPPGARIRGPDEAPATVPQVSLEEAARRAPFKVFTPRRIPEAAQMSISLDSGRRRPTMPASARGFAGGCVD